MYPLLMASALGLVLSWAVQANEAVHTPEISITATRIPQDTSETLADISVITHEEIEQSGLSTLTELLQTQPGIEISANGGLGKSSSVFLRGSNADHVVVLLDGLRINSATLGTTAWENIPLSQIDHIEILRGAASSLYGADAIGGVIQIFTKRGEGPFRITGFAGLGSDNTRRFEVGFSGSRADTRYALNFSALATDGFPAQKAFNHLKTSDPYYNHSVSAQITQRIADEQELSVQLLQSDGRNYYDGCGKTLCFADGILRSYGISSSNRINDIWKSTLSIGRGEDHSHDFSYGSTINTDQNQLTWQNELSLALGTLILAYDRLEQKVSGSTVYTIDTRHNNGWVAEYLVSAGPHSVQLNLRSDDNSQYGQHSTGSIAYGYRFTPDWRASASMGTAFKAPTFNQLYYPGFGNPNLRPEQSRNREVALHYEHAKLQGRVVMFDNEITDLIQFSGPPSGFDPVNVSRADILGATAETKWTINDHWQSSLNFTLQSPINTMTDTLLIRRSRAYGAGRLDYRNGALTSGVEVSGAGARFDNAANTQRLGGYTLVNLLASYQLQPDWRLEGRINNLFNKAYELASGYNTPGVSLFVGLRYQPQ